jgi:hypothetical protein
MLLRLLPLLILVGWVWHYRRDLPLLWRKPTDVDALRKRLGYGYGYPGRIGPNRAYRQRLLLGFWPLRTNWGKVRKRLGY